MVAGVNSRAWKEGGLVVGAWFWDAGDPLGERGRIFQKNLLTFLRGGEQSVDTHGSNKPIHEN
jgi:hypothetical protein